MVNAMGLNLFLLFLVAFCSSFLLTPLVRQVALRMKILDEPSGRKIHAIPTPRLGGVGIALSMGLSLLFAVLFSDFTGVRVQDLAPLIPVGIGAAIVWLGGLWDDLRPLPNWAKALIQTSAAVVTIWLGTRIEAISVLGEWSLPLGIFGLPLTFLWIMGITNAFNLIDGLDGLASGLGLIAAATGVAILYLSGGNSNTIVLVILCGVLAGFLLFNFHPASIFLGDSGSQLIGYVLAVTAIGQGGKQGVTVLTLIGPVLFLGLPILDTMLAIARRSYQSLQPVIHGQFSFWKRIRSLSGAFQADRDHVHHRMLTLGHSHRSAVLTLYTFALALSVLAVAAVTAHYRNVEAILIILLVSGYFGIRKLGYAWRARERSHRIMRWSERMLFTRVSSFGRVDVVLIAICYWLAFILKYDVAATSSVLQLYLMAFPFVMASQLLALLSLGLYQTGWRTMGVSDFVILSLSIWMAVLSSSIVLALFDPPFIVWGFLMINGLLLQVALLGWRAVQKVLRDMHRQNRPQGERTAVIYGAGRRGAAMLEELRANPSLGIRVVGFIDDDPELRNLKIHRVPVLGSSHDLPEVVSSHKVSTFIVCSSKICRERLALSAHFCLQQQIPVLGGQFQLYHLVDNSRQEGDQACGPLASLPDRPRLSPLPDRSSADMVAGFPR
jgi:UDP-GlcNAc:undecaprenyl-phosphate/decaprenyl-phosphate GlcNAc-1-phosphate transferase